MAVQGMKSAGHRTLPASFGLQMFIFCLVPITDLCKPLRLAVPHAQVLVEVEVEVDQLSIVLQNAETVRLVSTPQGGERSSIAVTQLSMGDVVLVHQQAGARHTGIAVQETIIER